MLERIYPESRISQKNIVKLSIVGYGIIQDNTILNKDNTTDPVNCYIKLTYNVEGKPAIQWHGPEDDEEQEITLDKLLSIK